MEIKVRVEKVLTPVPYVSKRDGNTQNRNGFVGLVLDGSEYEHRIKFDVFTDERFAQMGVVVGAELNVSFDVVSREWNDKWITSVTAYRAEVVANASVSADNAPKVEVKVEDLYGRAQSVQGQSAPSNASDLDPLPF